MQFRMTAGLGVALGGDACDITHFPAEVLVIAGLGIAKGCDGFDRPHPQAGAVRNAAVGVAKWGDGQRAGTKISALEIFSRGVDRLSHTARDNSQCRDKQWATHRSRGPPDRQRKTVERIHIMAKFYVQSGLISHIVTANDAFSAALWAMHLVMEDVVPVDQVDWLDQADVPEHGFADGLYKLGATVAVSEVGFGRDEAGRFDTADTLAEWNQLVIALARLEARLEADRNSSQKAGRGQQPPSPHRMIPIADLLP